MKFSSAGLGGIAAWFVIHPADLMKVRMQLVQGNRRSLLGVGKNIVKSEGVRGLYSGLSSGIARQVSWIHLLHTPEQTEQTKR